jgi:hypothetical protein
MSWRLRTSRRHAAETVVRCQAHEQEAVLQVLKVCGAGDRGHRVYAAAERDGLVRLMVAAAQQSLGLSITVQTRTRHAHCSDVSQPGPHPRLQPAVLRRSGAIGAACVRDHLAHCLKPEHAVQSSAGTAAEHEHAKRAGYVAQSQSAPAAPLREFWLQRVKVPVAFFRGGRAPEGTEDGVGRFGRCASCPTCMCAVQDVAGGLRTSR